MKKIYHLIALFVLTCTLHGYAQQAPAEGELTDLLNRFLEGASINDADMHDRFWAEDLIYTSSSGERFGKKQIMDGLADASEQQSESTSTSTYSAEDIQIQQYGDMAVVAFRLVGKTETEEGVNTDYYLNSGTFFKRNGQWKVVNWQATKVPDK